MRALIGFVPSCSCEADEILFSLHCPLYAFLSICCAHARPQRRVSACPICSVQQRAVHYMVIWWKQPLLLREWEGIVTERLVAVVNHTHLAVRPVRGLLH